MTTVHDFYQWLDAIAPFDTQDAYDNSGFLIGDPAAAVHRVLFSVDVTLSVVAQAARQNANLIISHHPLMFSPIQQLRWDQGEGAVIRALAASGISLISAHTNLDRCTGGVADSLANALALEKITASASDPYLRTGELAVPCTAKALLSLLNSRLSASALLHGDPEAVVRSVAVVPGAGGDSYPHAQAGALVTGELKHHEIIDACARGLIVFEAGHYETEFPGIAALYQRFLATASDHDLAAEALLFSQPSYPCITHV
ncbi:MAG TPA: Nif3-like dinuclear metal center hexameric protein [Candidatus Limiplasma sp.]|nr:Nif3-like dinuclear metal center hexameric protein [Candidatus Limiplasma sp.]